MKTKFILSLIACSVFILSSCNHNTISTGDGEKKIEGNGKPTTDLRDVGSFHSIQINGVFKITLEQGPKESVTVETDENILPLVISIVENDTLKVKIIDGVSIGNVKSIGLTIRLVDISKLNTESVGSLRCASTLNLKSLSVKCNGVGETNLNINAENLSVKSDIVGALILSGNVKNVNIDHDGVGAIKAFDLKSETLSLTASGVGSAEVYATEEITINASGVGNVKYKGGAKKRNITADNVGKVTEIE